MTVPLSKLMADGAGGARIAFGADGGLVSAAELTERGSALFRDDAGAAAVGVLMTNDQPTVEILLGAIATGASVVSLPVPSRGADLGAYLAFLARVCRSHQVGEIVVSDDVARLIGGEALPGIAIRSHGELGSRPLAAPASQGFRLVQFSSGSTSQPKPVVLDDAALGANVAAILETVQPRPGDVAVSWLPLSHDMGLVGMLLVSIAAAGPRWAEAGPIVLLDPVAFLRRPSLWLEAVSHWRGSVTAAPDFGYRMATQRRPSGPVDLSSLRCAIVGGEIVRAETLTAFGAGYQDHGLDPTALCPAYGMAELGLAATMTPLGDHWRSRALAIAALADNQVVVPRPDEPAVTLVASGPPVPGYGVRCDAGDVGEAASTGPISVRGPSIGVNGDTEASYADADGWYTTDDAGFFSDDGWLYVCGRVDDHIVAHGRNLYAPAIEAAVADVAGMRAGRVTAVGLPSGDWVIVAEPAGDEPLSSTRTESLRREVRRAAVRVGTAQPDEVVIVRRGSLPLTPSGKLQRNEVRKRLLVGELRSWEDEGDGAGWSSDGP